jgi:hypothetical protein
MKSEAYIACAATRKQQTHRVMGQFEIEWTTNFNLSPEFDNLKLVGHQTDEVASKLQS